MRSGDGIRALLFGVCIPVSHGHVLGYIGAHILVIVSLRYVFVVVGQCVRIGCRGVILL